VNTYDLIFKALSDPTRRIIFERLMMLPRSVTEIARDLPVSRPAVSQHLQILKGAGLVKVTSTGTSHEYTIDSRGVQQLREYTEQFWDQALDAFKNYIELSNPEEQEDGKN
jgi:DNA-binding transcriptional ArsR family regulator